MNPPPADDVAISNFMRWFEQGRVHLSKMHILPMEDAERGVFALEDIAQGEMLLRLPLQYLVDLPTAKSSDIGRLIEAHTPIQDPNRYMASFLLQERERGEASFFKPCIDVLPQTFPTHPLYFGERERALLKGSLLVDVLPLERKVLQSEYELMCRQIPGFSRFTFDMFLWADLAVITRVFGAQLNGNKVNAFAPFVDMMNDSMPANARWGWSPDGQFFEVTAVSRIPKGQEVRISYGDASNLHLLRYYGFVRENNPSNEVMVPLELPSADPFMDEKRRLLGLTDPSDQPFFTLPSKTDSPRVQELFSDLRIVYANAEEMAQLKAAPDPVARAKQPVSPDNEKRVRRGLAEACKARLALYETSVEEDARLLQQKNLSRNERNCILLRQGEKQILQLFARIAD
jgi:histone-lysine N-methyltransferase SETD3